MSVGIDCTTHALQAPAASTVGAPAPATATNQSRKGTTGNKQVDRPWPDNAIVGTVKEFGFRFV